MRWVTVVLDKLTGTHKRLIVGTLIFFGVLGFMVGTDTTVNSLFKNHEVNETHPVTNITVTGDGSSGTGDVENNVVYATDGGTSVQTVQTDTSSDTSATTLTGTNTKVVSNDPV
jgi:hypothetical protein